MGAPPLGTEVLQISELPVTGVLKIVISILSCDWVSVDVL